MVNRMSTFYFINHHGQPNKLETYCNEAKTRTPQKQLVAAQKYFLTLWNVRVSLSLQFLIGVDFYAIIYILTVLAH